MNALQITNKMRGIELRKAGIILFERADYQNALSKFQEALQLIPDNIQTQLHYELCKCVLRSTETEESVKKIQKLFQQYVSFIKSKNLSKRLKQDDPVSL